MIGYAVCLMVAWGCSVVPCIWGGLRSTRIVCRRAGLGEGSIGSDTKGSGIWSAAMMVIVHAAATFRGAASIARFGAGGRWRSTLTINRRLLEYRRLWRCFLEVAASSRWRFGVGLAASSRWRFGVGLAGPAGLGYGGGRW